MSGHSNQQVQYPSGPTVPLSVTENMFRPSQTQSLWPLSNGNAGVLDPSSLAKIQQSQLGLDPRSITTPATSATMNMFLLQQQMNAALLTQSMDSAGEVSNSIGSDDVSFTAAGLNNILMRMDIPSSNFTKAINFEAALSDEGKIGDDNGEAEEEYDDEGECESLDDQGSYTQNSFDTSSDLLEQQQAQQQSTLLAKFKQLREWQHKQQELLMMQQQKQLELLREEQERVQRMVVKQREMQWGASNSGKNGLAATMPHNASLMGSPRKSNLWPASSGGMMKTMGPQSSTVPTKNYLQVAQTGRPVPQLVAQYQNRTNVQELGEGNQEFDSDTDSQYSIREEGVFPLPESTTKMNTQQGILVNSRRGPHMRDQYSDDQTSLNMQNARGDGGNISRFHTKDVKHKPHPAFQENMGDHEVIGDSQYDEYEHIDSVSDVYEEERELGNDGRNGESMNYYTSDVVENHASSIPNTDGLDFRETQQRQYTRTDGRSTKTISPRYLGGEEDAEVGLESADERSEEESHDEDSNNSCHCETNDNADFDDMPVAGLGAKKKTFEELVEEELRREEERQKQGSVSPVQSGSGGKKKPFLRRGEGIARFSNGSASRRPEKTKRRSRSRSKGSEKKTTTNNDFADQRPSKNGSGDSGDGQGSGKRKASQPTDTPQARGLPPKGSRRILNTLNQKPPAASKNNKQKPNQMQGPPSGNQRQAGKPLPKSSLQNKQLVLNKPVKTGSAETEPKTDLKSIQPPESPLISVHDTPSKYSDISSLGETSFQARLTQRAEMEVYETHDLAEFEMLEQYADDNASFLSNVSTVNKVIQKNLPQTSVIPHPSNSVRKPPPYAPEPAQPVFRNTTQDQKQPPNATAVNQAVIDSSSDAENEDTSVSTDFDEDTDSAKAPEREEKEDDMDTTLVDSPDAKAKVRPPPDSEITDSEYSHVKPVQRKVAVKTQASKPDSEDLSVRRNLLASVQQFSDSDVDLMNSAEYDAVSDEDEKSDSVLPGAKRAMQGSQPKHHGADKANPNVGVDKDIYIYQPGDRYIETTDDDKSVSDVMENKKDKNGNDPAAFHMNFNDEDAWNESHCEDETETPTPTSSESISSHQVIRKSILNRQTVLPKPSREETAPAVPPTSQLVGKLFPKLKEDKSKPKMEPRDEQRLTHAKHTEPESGIQCKQLRDKLAELEQEIEKFRSENNTLGRLRKEREDGLEQLKKEMSEFEKQKDEELKRLQEFKSEEMKKLKRERKQFEVYQQNIRAMPAKRDREELDTLKTQLSELQDEVKRKESRWSSSMSRLREKCEALTTENEELKEEIKILEKQRLTAWQKKDAAPKMKEESRPSTSKTLSVQQLKSPSPESHPPRPPPGDSQLRLSNNLDLNDSDLRAEDPPTPHTALRRLSESNLLNKTGQGTGLPAPQSDQGAGSESKKPIPRKRAVPQSITNTVDKGNEEYEEVQHPDGKVEKIYSNGAREILFANGTRKQVSSDGQSIIVSFFNGDMKQILPDQRVVYYYADAQTTHTTYPDGLEILQFPNQQMEKHYPDGTKEITFPDQTIKYLFPNGIEESIYADGTVTRIEKSGEKTVEFPNGQREIHTEHYKRREYPDGTVKTVYPDGRQETRYSSGRVRVKDNQGNVIVDKRM